MSVVPKAFTSVTAADCAIETKPVLVPAPSLTGPAFTGPENVVVAIIYSLYSVKYVVSIPSA